MDSLLGALILLDAVNQERDVVEGVPIDDYISTHLPTSIVPSLR